MELILRGEKEEKFIIDKKTANLIKDIIRKEKQQKSIKFMLDNKGKLKDLDIEEKDIYMQGDEWNYFLIAV